MFRIENNGYKKKFYHFNSTENEKFPKTLILINLKHDIQAHKDISEESWQVITSLIILLGQEEGIVDRKEG